MIPNLWNCIYLSPGDILISDMTVGILSCYFRLNGFGGGAEDEKGGTEEGVWC